MKQTIKLTESELRSIIMEAVENTLKQQNTESLEEDIEEGVGNWFKAGINGLSNMNAYSQGDSNSKLSNFVSNVARNKQHYDDRDTINMARRGGYENAPSVRMAAARDSTYSHPESNRQYSDSRHQQAGQEYVNAQKAKQRAQSARIRRAYDKSKGF